MELNIHHDKSGEKLDEECFQEVGIPQNKRHTNGRRL